MEIHQISAFLAVAEELHFGRAALRLHVGQPPLSRTIRQLEKAFGTPLFDRNTRNVRLTAAGEALVQPARDILDSCRMAEIAVAAAGKGQTGRVRIGFAGASSHLLIGQWAKLVRKVNPGIEFVLNSTAYANEALSKVMDGTLDVGMVRWTAPPPGIASRLVATEELLVALPVDHPLADRSSLDMTDLQTEAWVALPGEPGSSLRDALLRTADQAGYFPRIVQSAPDSFSLMALVSAEVGISLTLSTVAQSVNNPGVVFRPLSNSPEPLELRLAWRNDNESPALREVLRLSEEALPTPDGYADR
jgi:DNA-binding transcriptional LysR family regulator